MKHLVAVSIAAVVTLGAAVAFAQPTPAEQARARAQELNKEGVARLGRDDFAGALDQFQRAWEEFPSPKVLVNIAASLRELGRDADAANAYQRYLDDPGAETARRAEITEILVTLDARLGVVAITATPAEAELQVVGAPPGWWLPGTDEPWLPAEQVRRWRVTPGPFIVRARAAGHVDGKTSGTLNAGTTTDVAFALELSTSGTPDVVVDDDGEPAGPVGHRAVPARRRALRVGALLELAIDGGGAGAAVSPGVAVVLRDRFELSIKGLFSGHAGAAVAARVYLLQGRLRPSLGVGAPVFFSDGLRPGLRAEAGASLRLNARAAIHADLGVEHFFRVEMGRPATVLVPVLGVHIQL